MVDLRNTSKLTTEQSKGEFTTFYLKHAFPVVWETELQTTLPPMRDTTYFSSLVIGNL